MSYMMKRLFNWFRKRHEDQYRECFEQNKRDDGKCYGLYGPDREFDHLNAGCVYCPHLTLTPYLPD